MNKLTCSLFSCVAFGAVMLNGGAWAMPVAPLQSASQEIAPAPQNVRWVCGPYRCWWRPNWYGPRWYGGYGPRWHRWGYARGW